MRSETQGAGRPNLPLSAQNREKRVKRGYPIVEESEEKGELCAEEASLLKGFTGVSVSFYTF